ncbi:MAG: DNA translocase FtsK 4TM domain-containing protein, partial [Elusimicrobia bacterium]|nr:DNA translocase FtsK 4TM domain-containing protein [Elusimicrobiota bacterium]
QRAKTKKNLSGEIRGFLFLLFAFVIGYFIIIPEQSGVLGKGLSKFSFLVFGHASYIIPLVLAWLGIVYLSLSYKHRLRLDTVFSLLLLCSASAFFSLSGIALYGVDYGGMLGTKLNPLFFRLFGKVISLLVTFLLSFYFITRLLRISVKVLTMSLWQRLMQDFKEWQEARNEARKTIPVRRNTQQPAVKPQPRFEEPKAVPIKPVEPKIIVKENAAPPIKKTQSSENKKELKILPNKNVSYKGYTLPDLSLLSDEKGHGITTSEGEHRQKAVLLMKTLKDFDIEASVEMIISGPVVTRYELSLAPGIKVQEVISLSENIGLAMKSPSIRIISVPEKSMVGVEVPNAKPAVVGLKGVLSGEDFQNSKSLLTLALGKMTDGTPYISDLSSMPHLMIAGATGSGKSVGIHSIILSILYKACPDEVKFMIIDPKRVEMPLYRKLPHLYDPSVPAEKADIITTPKNASQSLKKLVQVMEMRYEKYAKEIVRNIEGYNEKMAEKNLPKDFYIIVIIDELADLMVAASKEIEDNVQRLAQMARAVGIHLILATQRPSVNVITGVIKANFPARIAFQTTSKVDSRVILDTIGADSLLGRGDLLFMPPGDSRLIRLQGSFVSVKEAERVVDFIYQQNFPKQYEDFFSHSSSAPGLHQENEKELKELSLALQLVKERKRVSQDLLKAHFGSSARATNILSLMEIKGFIGKPEGTNRWTIFFDKIDEYLDATIHSVNNEQIN